jgi:cytochrome c biogenesis protein
MVARLIRVIASARLAAWLIGIQLGFLVASFLIPQRGIFPDDQVDSFLGAMPGPVGWLFDALALDHVFTSALYYAAAGLLAVNLIVCTWERVAKRLGRAATRGTGAVPDTALVLAVRDPVAVASVLASLGARATEVGEGETRYYLRRGGAGFIGSVVMHAALVLVLIGGVLTGVTTFRGEMLFTEGQARFDTPDDYLSVSQVPSVGSDFRDFAIPLKSMEFTYEDGTVVDAVANLQVTDASGDREEAARVNYPLKVRGKSFLLQDAGHSVWITVTDPAGTVVLDSFVNLLNVTDRGYEDSFGLPNGELQILSRPDASQPLDEKMTEGLRITSPIVGLSMADPDASEDPVWVVPGSAGVTVGGYTMRVNEVRVWNRFMVRADAGRHVIYLSFALIIAGTLVRFIDPDRWLKAALAEGPDGARLHLWGAVRYSARALPKEADLIARLVSPPADPSEPVAGADMGDNPSKEVRRDS